MTAGKNLLAVKGRLLPYLVVIVIDIICCVRRQPTGGGLSILLGWQVTKGVKCEALGGAYRC